MKLETIKDVADAVYAGRAVVCFAESLTHRIALGREIMSATHRGWTIKNQPNGLLYSGAGFLHIVIKGDEACLNGMEYTDHYGEISDLAKTRIRNPTEEFFGLPAGSLVPASAETYRYDPVYNLQKMAYREPTPEELAVGEIITGSDLSNGIETTVKGILKDGVLTIIEVLETKQRQE